MKLTDWLAIVATVQSPWTFAALWLCCCISTLPSDDTRSALNSRLLARQPISLASIRSQRS
jgi:hypothetical protein